ncbi:hypothetical protein LTR15_003743 [Elasticomyces elasticus]|nr:hypothetical protein LTR15_003743 [Elasticomyces elasticus]
MQNGHHGIEVRRIAGSLGAEILNVDLKTLDDAATKQIQQVFLEHKVIFFRKQDLEPQQFLDFAALFGQPVEYPFVKGIDGFPEIIQVLKQEHETINFGGVWHADTTYLPEPPKATILLAREVPPFGGDTLFADQAAAFEGLSDGLKTTLSSLRGISSSAKADASKTREDRIKDSGTKSKDLEACHPAVRTHPETGRKHLYVNVAHTVRFDGWTEAESQPLLKYLFEHQVRPEYTCRFRWETSSIAMWNNAAVLHNPVNDYHGYRRCMHRITLAGDKPV